MNLASFLNLDIATGLFGRHMCNHLLSFLQMSQLQHYPFLSVTDSGMDIVKTYK